MMFDLMALAYQANLTRIATYMMVAEGTARAYTHLGVSDGFHAVTHHANVPDRLVKLTKHPDLAHAAVREVHRTRWRQRPMATVRWLDHSAVHVRLEHEQQRPAQQLSAAHHPGGGANGKMKAASTSCRRRRRRWPTLHLTVLNLLGMPQEKFSNSTGVLPECRCEGSSHQAKRAGRRSCRGGLHDVAGQGAGCRQRPGDGHQAE